MSETLDMLNAKLLEMKELAETDRSVAPHEHIDLAMAVNVLKHPLERHIIALQQSLAKKRYDILLSGKTAAFAKIAVESDDDYSLMKELDAKVDMIEEQIRLAKYRARMADNDYRSN